MSNLRPAIKQEFLIQLREHCGVRSYALAMHEHKCGVCGEKVGSSGEPWEIYQPDTTPKRGGTIT